MPDRRRLFKGAVHVHTDLSYDGKHTMSEVTEFLKGKGYDFVIISEHSHSMDADKVEKLVGEAARLSSGTYLVIPGLEFTCRESIHIIGMGVTSLCESDEPSTVIDHIHGHDGVAFLAHPWIRDYPLRSEWVSKLDGSEIWNVSNDGKYAPQPEAVRLFNQLVRWNRSLKPLGSLDLHHRSAFYPVTNAVLANTLDQQSIIEAFRNGDYLIESILFTIKGSPDFNRYYVGSRVFFRRLLNVGRWLRDRIQS